MFLSKIVCASVLVFAATFAAGAQTRAAKDWTIADYLKNLPEKYKTFSGDFSPPYKETTIIDEPNGYAAYLNSPLRSDADNSPFPIFEMALFNSETKPPLVVVSNLISDPVCEKYETFFLRRVGKNWTEVKREVLPPIDLKLFWQTAPQSAERLLRIVKETAISHRFKLPRRGTQIRASLEICDYLEDGAPENAAKELEKLIGSAGIVRLDWNAKSRTFYFARYELKLIK